MDYVKRNCPICGSDNDSLVILESNFDETRLDDYSFASRKYPEYMHYRLVICPECDVLYATHIPHKEWITSAYGQAKYESEDESYYAARTYNKHFRKILPNLPDKQSALDIGAGNGSFLVYLQEEGFNEIEGIEPSEAPIEVARADIKRLIRKGEYSPGNPSSSRYSLVTCFQTLEHLDHIKDVFSSVYESLKPGGAFLVVTHDYRSFITKILGRKSPLFDIEHLQLFSAKSIEYVFKNTGFKTVTVRSIANCYPLHYWIKLFPFGQSFKMTLISMLKKISIGYLPIPLKVGNMVAVGYKRKSIAE